MEKRDFQPKKKTAWPNDTTASRRWKTTTFNFQPPLREGGFEGSATHQETIHIWELTQSLTVFDGRVVLMETVKGEGQKSEFPKEFDDINVNKYLRCM